MTALRPTLFFLHGWAFDDTVWDALRAQLRDWSHVIADEGYFGSPSWPTPSGPVVAIGHSHGFMRLLGQLPAQCIGMIAINGFARFTAAPDYPQGVAPRVLDRMLARLDQQPATVINDFRQRCGADVAPATAHLSPTRLHEGLQALRDDDQRNALLNVPPLLALAGDDDPIVPRAMSEAAFAQAPGASMAWHGGGHLLPLSAPDWCAARIREWLAQLAESRLQREGEFVALPVRDRPGAPT